MKIAVTGASGFIGQHVVRHLIGCGFHVVAGVRPESKAAPDLATYPAFRKVVIGKAGERFGPLCDGVDAVVHLAGLASAPSNGEVEAALRTANVHLTEELARTAENCGVRRLIHLSSIRAVVGASSAHVIDDAVAPCPVDPYGRSKLDSEKVVAAFAGANRLAVCLRPPLVIGPDARNNWRRLQLLAASGAWLPFAGIRNQRSYLSVQTLCEALSHLAGSDWSEDLSGAYCCADPGTPSLAEAVTALRSGMNRPRRLFAVPGLPALQHLPAVGGMATSLFGSLCLDPTRFFQTFGFQPSHSILDAIAASGAAFVSNAR